MTNCASQATSNLQSYFISNYIVHDGVVMVWKQPFLLADAASAVARTRDSAHYFNESLTPHEHLH